MVFIYSNATSTEFNIMIKEQEILNQFYYNRFKIKEKPLSETYSLMQVNKHLIIQKIGKTFY